MPEATQQQTSIDAKAGDALELGPVVLWNGRFGFAKPDRGGPDVYLGMPELMRAGIQRLEVGVRVCFEARKATHHRQRWCARIRLVEPTA